MNIILLFIFIIILVYYTLTFKEGYTGEVQKVVDILAKNSIDQEKIDLIGSDIENNNICSPDTLALYSGESNYALTLNQDDIRELVMKDYKLKIESGENFHMKLSELEEKVFQSYYGDTWQEEYNKMLERRQRKIDTDKVSSCNMNVVNETDINVSTDTLDINLVQEAVDVLKYLEDLEEFTKNNYNTHDKSAITARKIHYRDKEEAKIEWINSWFNYLYYILYISAILLTINKGKLFAYKFTLMVLLILPTIVYPLLYKLVKYIVLQTTDISLLPKNSF